MWGGEVGDKYFNKNYSNHFLTFVSNVWPQSQHLLCSWHCCNAIWKWIWQASHGVRKEDRPPLYRLFHDLLYAQTDAEYDAGTFTNIAHCS